MKIGTLLGTFVLTLLAGVSQAGDMPSVVRQIPEARHLWMQLSATSSLPGSWFSHLRGPPSEAWQSFVKEQGDTILKEA